MPTTTQYYHLQLPDVGGSEDLWGGLLNGDLSQIDTQLYNRVVKSLTGSDTINGSPQVIDTALWVAAQQDGVSPVGGGNVQERSVASARWVETRVYAILNTLFPVGTILMWSLGVAAIGLAVACVAVVRWIVARELRPVEHVAAQATRIGPETLDLRFDVASLPAELKPICLRLNDLPAGSTRRFSANDASTPTSPTSCVRRSPNCAR